MDHSNMVSNNMRKTIAVFLIKKTNPIIQIFTWLAGQIVHGLFILLTWQIAIDNSFVWKSWSTRYHQNTHIWYKVHITQRLYKQKHRHRVKNWCSLNRDIVQNIHKTLRLGEIIFYRFWNGRPIKKRIYTLVPTSCINLFPFAYCIR